MSLGPKRFLEPTRRFAFGIDRSVTWTAEFGNSTSAPRDSGDSGGLFKL